MTSDEKDTRLVLMRFIDSITQPRAKMSPDTFCRDWDADQTRVELGRVGHTFAEYLNSGTRPGKLFLDRDVYVGKTAPTEEIVNLETDIASATTKELLSRLSTPRTDLSFVLATRHGYCKAKDSHKLSFRPFVQGMRIRYTDIPTLITWAGQDHFWDMSVYKAREQLMAAVNGCKGMIGGMDDRRILQAGSGTDDILRYVVQHVEPEWPFLDLPARPVTLHMQRLPCNTGKEFIRRMVECLSCVTSDDRRTWIAIGVALKSEPSGDYYSDWLKFSRKGEKFKSDDDCAVTWAGLRSEFQSVHGPSCGIGTLLFHAKRDCPERYRKIMTSRKRPPASVVPTGSRLSRCTKDI